MSDILGKLTLFGISVAIAFVIAALIWFVHRYLLKMYSGKVSEQHNRQLIMIGLSVLGLILAVLLMPVGDEMRGQLLSFLAILLSATIALASTTIVGNAMAGLMVRSLHSFHIGDYVTVGEHFGRISSMDLLHVEIRTEDRDLTTMPNLYVVTNPVTVLRESGTILHVEVSLGYDIPRQKIEAALIDAAERTGLEKPFVQIRNLGDFSASYRVAGLLQTSAS
jgi:small-conductance mechanosensitive channel